MDIQKLANATIDLNESLIDEKINSIQAEVNAMGKDVKTAWLIRAIGFIDLTSLNADDTCSKVEYLCAKAMNPFKASSNIKQNIHTASIYVYPLLFPVLKSALNKFDKEHKVFRSTVAGAFPSGQFPLETRLREVEIAVELGADEIDVVINRPLVLMQQWEELYDELKSFRTACGNKVCLKVILATGELQYLENIYKASMVAMIAGADFIKTSTGKEATNATLTAGIVMSQAIRDYYTSTNRKVGLKPAGGLKNSKDALEWMMLLQMELGDEWLTKDLFRIGASSLLDNIIAELEEM